MKTLLLLLVSLFLTQLAYTQSESDQPSTTETIDTIAEAPQEPTGEIYKLVEQMPLFPGCESHRNVQERKYCADMKMLQWIYANLQYPEEAKEQGIEDTGFVSFVVEKDGTLSNIKVTRSFGYGMEEEMLRLVNKMNEDGIRWNPGRQRGELQRVLFNLPIRFRL